MNFLNYMYIKRILAHLGGSIIPVWIASLFFITGCENSPTQLGQQYLPGDTLYTKVLDSQKDTMAINTNSFVHYVNTVTSSRIFMGNYQGYSSLSFMRFKDLANSYDSCTVLSAKLYLNYANYSFYDSTGNNAFNIYPVVDTVNYDTITYNSFSNNLIGTQIVGSYSGNPTYNAKLILPLDTGMVRKWLLLSANSNYPYYNYGIAFKPTAAATNIKGFFSYINGADSVKPVLEIVVLRKDLQIDSIRHNYSEAVSFTTNTGTVPNDRFIIQPGYSYWTKMNFDISKVPSNVTINNATLTFYLDKSSSTISTGNDGRVRFAMLTDSSSMATDGYYYYTSSSDSVTYNIYLNQIFQRWNFSVSNNLGVLLNYIYDGTGIDRYVFYSSTYSDISKRPRLVIRYTPRDNMQKNGDIKNTPKQKITND